MKAAVWTDYGKIEIQEVPEPAPNPGQVKIQVMSAGVCVTDLHVYTGQFRYGKPPHILGHEIAGIVVEAGTKADESWLGKRVVVETSIGCGSCEFCRSGNRHLCAQMTEIGTFPNQGGYAQYLCVPAQNLFEIPEGVTFDEAGIVESVVCPAGSLMRLGVKFAESAVVFGVGPAGLAFIQTAKLLGAGKVIAVARSEEHLERSKLFGADIIINAKKEDVLKRILEETGGMGADLAMEAAGAVSTVQMAVSAVRAGGRVILYGIPGDDAELPFPIQTVITRQLELYGAVGNPFVWKPLLELVQQGRINLKDMVTATYPLEQIEAAFAAIEDRSRHIIKAVVHPWEGME